MANKNELDNIKSLIENGDAVIDKIEENSRNDKLSESNLTSEIMKRMEKLDNQNHFENEETRISNRPTNLKMMKIESTPVSMGGKFRGLDTPE